MVRLAIAHWQGRVSPVFDVAASILVIEIDGEREVKRWQTEVDIEDPKARAARLLELGIDVLICGAVSWPLALAIESAGIQLIPQTCGNLESVLSAYIHGQLHQDTFLMPGCRGRCRQLRSQHLAGDQKAVDASSEMP